MKRLFQVLGLALIACQIVVTLPPSVEQIQAARASIAICIERFHKVSALRELIEKRQRMIFKRKKRKVDLQIFDELFGQFTTFLADERKVMTAHSGNAMGELGMAYSSNCSRFAKGIETFVDFSMGKPVSKDFTRYFKRERKFALTGLMKQSNNLNKKDLAEKSISK